MFNFWQRPAASPFPGLLFAQAPVHEPVADRQPAGGQQEEEPALDLQGDKDDPVPRAWLVAHDFQCCNINAN